VRCAGRYGGWRTAQTASVLGMDNAERISFGDRGEGGIGGSWTHGCFPRGDQSDGIVEGSSDSGIILCQFFEERPAVGFANAQQPDAAAATEGGAREGNLILPAGIRKIGPARRRHGRRYFVRIVDQQMVGRAIGIVSIGIRQLPEQRQQLGGIGRFVIQ
jgi:hypothetical protein